MNEANQAGEVPTLIYPVGLLSTLQVAVRVLTVRDHRGIFRGKRWGAARAALRSQRRYLLWQARAHNWRAVRNSFNGYLAEHSGCAHNAGKGWTKRAAKRRVEHICRDHIDHALATAFPPAPERPQ